LGSSLFARHYSGSRGFFPFLRVLRCFSSPACLFLPYVFRQEYARITTRRFPHSEILGSTDGQLLPEAYRSRPRPSSALGAKASTVCPFSLDRKEHVMCCRYGVFKVRVSSSPPYREPSESRPVSQNSTALIPPTHIGAAGIRRFVEVDVVSRRVRLPDGPKTIDGADAYRSNSSGIP
jgi:hypothetical protein